MELDSIATPWLWGGFGLLVVAATAVDLGLMHKKGHHFSLKQAAAWSGVWVSLAVLFGGVLWRMAGPGPALEFFTGYVIEKALSIDNLFVFVVIFGALKLGRDEQHSVLSWGIIGALLMRAAMIFAGAALLERFQWLLYVFGGFLVLTGVKLFWHRDEETKAEDNQVMRLARRLIPATDQLDGLKFFTRVNGRRLATPLFLAVVMVELTDVVFAVDSIPAIFAVTQDPFIVFTSNIFAILGLRALFFLIAGAVTHFRYMKVGLAAVLVFVGLKLGAHDFVHMPAALSLGVVLLLLGASIVASIVVDRREKRRAPATPLRTPTPREAT